MKTNKKDIDIIDVENTYIFTQKEKAALRKLAEKKDERAEIYKELLVFVKLTFAICFIMLILLVYYIFLISSM